MIALEKSKSLIDGKSLWLLRFGELETSFKEAVPQISEIAMSLPEEAWFGFLGPDDEFDGTAVRNLQVNKDSLIIASLSQTYISQQARMGFLGHHTGWCPIFLENVDYIQESLLARVSLFRGEGTSQLVADDVPDLIVSVYRSSPDAVVWLQEHLVFCRGRKRSELEQSLFIYRSEAEHLRPPGWNWGRRRKSVDSRGQPSVEIVVPFRDRRGLTLKIIWSLLARTGYPKMSVVLIDNGSRDKLLKAVVRLLAALRIVKLLKEPGGFNFSALMNKALQRCEADIFVSLNNDVQVLDSNWLNNLVPLALRPDVGPVGCRLLFPDARIEHNGVVLGEPGLAHHVFEGHQSGQIGAPERDFPKTWSAVTAACMVIEAKKLRAVGGFDESFRVGGGDVDLCLRLGKSGLRSVVEPRVSLGHQRKATRGDRSVFPGDVRSSLKSYGSSLLDGDAWYQYFAHWNGRKWLETAIQALERSKVSGERTGSLPGGLLSKFGSAQAAEEAEPHTLSSPVSLQEAAVWFVPEVDSISRGGIHTALRVAEFLSANRAMPQIIVVCPLGASMKKGIGEWETEIATEFPGMSFSVITRKDFEKRSPDRRFRFGFATLWTTAYHLVEYSRHFERCLYLVQDYEPGFFPSGAEAELVKDTYRLGLEMICNTPSVEEAVAVHGNSNGNFLPGISDRYYPVREWNPRMPRTDEPFRLVLFSRPNNARNGFELIAGLAYELKTHFDSAVQLLLVGADFDETKFGLGGLVVNLGSLPSQRHVADLYRSSDMGVALSFSAHISYQPLEMMKCGLPLVSNRSRASEWLLNHGTNSLLSGPSVGSLFDTVRLGIDNPELRHRLRENALDSVSGLTWPASLQQVDSLMFPNQHPPAQNQTGMGLKL